MSYEVKVNNRSANVELLSHKGSRILIAIDGKEYDLDVEKVASGKYSILYRRRSFNIEIIAGAGVKQFVAHTFKNTYDVQIIDAEAKYLANRMKSIEEEGESTIVAPIPGRVVRIPVSVGEEVAAGQTVITISAMKMESDFKAKKQGKVVEILVKEGQTVDARQVLVIIEDTI